MEACQRNGIVINLDSEGLEMADVTEILLRPTGYSAVYPGTSPLSFARYLETPWTDVIIEPWQEARLNMSSCGPSGGRSFFSGTSGFR